MTTVAVIPSYNERDELPRAIAALRTQTVPPDEIVVALNNAAPGMVEVAGATGATVLDLGSCPGLKAEALNKAVAILLPRLHDTDLLLVADADGTLAPAWIETASARVDSTTIVGGVFLGEAGGGWLGRCQRNEYRAYSRELFARNDRAWVLTGTGTMFSAGHARAVLATRATLYNEHVSTEDFELTVAFKELRFTSTSPVGTEVTTEVMPTVRQLFDQRVRWYRGAVETLRLHGLSRATLPYFVQQAKIVLGASLSWVAMILVGYFAIMGQLTLTPLWLVALVPLAARIVSAEHKWFSALVVPELVYDVVLQGALVTGWWRAWTHKSRSWNLAEERG